MRSAHGRLSRHAGVCSVTTSDAEVDDDPTSLPHKGRSAPPLTVDPASRPAPLFLTVVTVRVGRGAPGWRVVWTAGSADCHCHYLRRNLRPPVKIVGQWLVTVHVRVHGRPGRPLTGNPRNCRSSSAGASPRLQRSSVGLSARRVLCRELPVVPPMVVTGAPS